MKLLRYTGLAAVFALTALAAFAFVQNSRVDRDELARMTALLRVEPGDVVADVGAGDGKWAVALAEIVGATGRVFATEVDPNDLKKIRDRVAREKTDNVTVIEGGQRDTGLPEACCDQILLRRVYHHFEEPAPMQESLRRALRPDGLLFIVDFETRRRWQRPAGIPESRSGHGIAQSMLVSEMEAAGFELVEQTKWANGDYGLLFRVAVID